MTELKNGHSKNCGCKRSEKVRKITIERNSKHGRTGTRLHTIWKNMRQRCSNPNASGYKTYGARGIQVCDEWNDFTCFREWALSSGYRDDLTIDRINNDGNYCPSNCQWLTRSENATKRNLGVGG